MRSGLDSPDPKYYSGPGTNPLLPCPPPARPRPGPARPGPPRGAQTGPAPGRAQSRVRSRGLGLAARRAQAQPRKLGGTLRRVTCRAAPRARVLAGRWAGGPAGASWPPCTVGRTMPSGYPTGLLGSAGSDPRCDSAGKVAGPWELCAGRPSRTAGAALFPSSSPVVRRSVRLEHSRGAPCWASMVSSTSPCQ